MPIAKSVIICFYNKPPKISFYAEHEEQACYENNAANPNLKNFDVHYVL